MKIEVTNRIALISDYSPQEEMFLKEHLSWGELSYKIDLFTTKYGNLPVSSYSEVVEGLGYQKSNNINILLAKLPDKRIYTLKYALYYVLEKFGDEIKFDFSALEKDKLPMLGKIDPNYLPDITLRDYQEKTLNKALAYGSGIVKSAVGSGKTEMQICLAKYFTEKNISDYVLVVCPSLALIDNFYERCKRYGVEAQVYSSGKTIDEKIRIIIANIDAVRNQLNKRGLYSKLLKKCKTIIVDETHHCRADSYFNMIVTINPIYLYEFSGTPFQNNDFYSNYPDFLVYALCGKVISNISTSYLIRRGFLAQPYFTFIPNGKKHLFMEKNWNVVENRYIVKNTERNKLICDWTKLFVKYKMKLLILVRKLDHMDLLLKQIGNIELEDGGRIRAIGVKGSKSGRMYDDYSGIVEEFTINYESVFNKFRNNEYDVMVANQVADEGVDITNINCLICATSGKSYIKVNQRIGRGVRTKDIGMNEVYVLDFQDNAHPYTAKHSRERRDHYIEMGAIELGQQAFVDRIYQNYQLINSENEK